MVSFYRRKISVSDGDNALVAPDHRSPLYWPAVANCGCLITELTEQKRQKLLTPPSFLPLPATPSEGPRGDRRDSPRIWGNSPDTLKAANLIDWQFNYPGMLRALGLGTSLSGVQTQILGRGDAWVGGDGHKTWSYRSSGQSSYLTLAVVIRGLCIARQGNIVYCQTRI